MNKTEIENAVADLIVARKERDHTRITAIEDYLADNNIEIIQTESGIRWKTL
jgi:hypothetical protein